jgi:hypothetical protein
MAARSAAASAQAPFPSRKERRTHRHNTFIDKCYNIRGKQAFVVFRS